MLFLIFTQLSRAIDQMICNKYVYICNQLSACKYLRFMPMFYCLFENKIYLLRSGPNTKWDLHRTDLSTGPFDSSFFRARHSQGHSCLHLLWRSTFNDANGPYETTLILIMVIGSLHTKYYFSSSSHCHSTWKS